MRASFICQTQDPGTRGYPPPATGHHHTQVKLSSPALPWPWLITMHHQPQQPPARHLTASLETSHHQELGSYCVHSVRCPHPPGCPGDLVLVTRSPCPHLHCPHTTAWCTMCTVHSPVLYTVHCTQFLVSGDTGPLELHNRVITPTPHPGHGGETPCI